MPLQFNVGELANRVRGFLGVRGRIPLALDEQVVPVVRAGDSTRVPFRLNERRYGFGSGAITVASGATPRYVGITPPQPAANGSQFVLEEFRVFALPASGTPAPIVEWGHCGFNGAPTGLNPPRLWERWPQSAAPDAELSIAVTINHYSGAPPAPRSTIGAAQFPAPLASSGGFLHVPNAEILLSYGVLPTVGPIDFYITLPSNATIQLVYQVFGVIRVITPQ